MYDGKYILVMNNNVGKLSNFHIATKSVKNTFQAVKDQSSYNGESENVPKKGKTGLLWDSQSHL